ncbi:MAG: hypothetical protein HWN68_07730 [Desulfobacterales bacterium]|nr:hypothetical protein [Desulfobacterales bacterium]
MRKDTWKIVAIVLGLIFIASYLGYITIFPARIEEEEPTVPGVITEDIPGVVYEAAAVKFGLKNAINGSSLYGGTNDYVSITVADEDGVVNFMQTWEQFGDIDEATESSSLTYNYGDLLIFHATSDLDTGSGAEHYGHWFYAPMVPGTPVRKLTSGILTATQTSPTYKYKIDGTGEGTGFKVQYIAGATPYWGVGLFPLHPRAEEAQMDMYLSYKSTNMSAVTDGATWVDEDGEQDNDVTLGSTTEELTVDLFMDTASLSFGLTQYTLTSVGQFLERPTFIIINTNATGIGVDRLYSYGWTMMSDSRATLTKSFYKQIDPIIPVKGFKGELTVKIPIDATALKSNTPYSMMVWFSEFQVEKHVNIGSVVTSITSAYGMVKDYGLDDVSGTTAATYSITSGKGVTSMLFGDWTTPT